MPESNLNDLAAEEQISAEAQPPVMAPIVEVPLIENFAELKLSAPVLESLKAAGFTKPTSIQAQFIPIAMTGVDVMGQAKTGTGKTAAFLLPIFEAIKPGGGEGSCQALILAPTRELALQIHGEISRLGSKLGYASITLYGGASYEPQIEALSNGVDIVVGTPGRVMDHMRSHRLDLSKVKVAVLDEADRMLDLGFRKDIEYILRHCPTQRQTLLLSATIPEDIRKLAQRFMYEPLEVWTAPESLTVDSVEQNFFVCEKQDKLPILLKLLEIENPSLAIVFCGTKMGAKRLAEKLKRLYINAREIHGDLQQSKREKILTRFRNGQVKLLIATDVASRGIDVQDITHIFNYDIPYKIEDYVHRIGRTGRIGKSGKAFTFVTREEGSYLTEIELLINKEIKRAHFEDMTSKWWPNPPKEPDADFLPEDPEGAGRIEVSEDSDRKRGGGSSRGSSGGGGGGRGRGREPRSERPRAARESSPVVQAAPIEGTAGEPVIVADGQAAPSGEGGERRPRRSRSRNRGREKVEIVCSGCGVSAMVNFKPEAGRPVFCEPCYLARKNLAGPKPDAAVQSADVPESAAPQTATE